MTRPSPDSIAPDAEFLEELARAAIETLPAPYAEAARALALRIEDFADPEILEAMGIADAYDLTGLYDGVPIPEKSVQDQPLQPDAIWLFLRPILEEWIERGNVSLGELVTHVMVHELAHHFGWSDDDIASIDPWWE